MSTIGLDNIQFDLPKNQSNVIKVIGVGGGGSNAINHMFQQGIKGVDFVICNTDSQALENSSVPIKIQLGVGLTEGLGAGANPEVGEKAALESEAEIKQMLDTNTKMIFITAGMGGGTGTGAAPVIARMARELDILTVGIVTSPFAFEGKMRNEQALLGVEKLRSQVDSLVVINNNKLREVYGNLGFKAGFSKADEVLSTAARGIAEVITHHYTQNIDLRDAKTVLSNSGTAIMGSATSSGASRAHEAISKALDSPLLNDNKITGAKNVLLLIVSGGEEITIDEIGEINDYIQAEAGHSANIIMGVGEEEALGEAVSVTVIATGFNVELQHDLTNTESKKIIHTLEEEQKAEQDLMIAKTAFVPPVIPAPIVAPKAPEKIVHTLDLEELELEDTKSVKQVTPTAQLELIPTTDFMRNLNVVYDEVIDKKPVDDIEVSNFQIVDVTPTPEASKETKIEVEQNILNFDIPSARIEQVEESSDTAPVVYNLEEDKIDDIHVNEPVQIVPVTEHSGTGEKRYVLDDYMEVEQQLAEAKAPETIVDEDLQFETKRVVAPKEEVSEEDLDPMNSPISKILVERAEERKRKMKEFNYKFHANQSRIDDIEKQPAYKRMGVDLDAAPNKGGKLSRTTLGSDDNDDIQLRSNNSFLHDNVD